MNPISTQVQPYTITQLGGQSSTITSVVVNLIQILENQSVNVSFSALDADGNVVQGGLCGLTDEQNNAWGADNSVIAPFVAINLGLTPVKS